MKADDDSESDWRTQPVGAHCKVVRGSSPRPAGSPLYFDGDFLPWITVADVTRQPGMYLNSTKSMLTEEGARFTRILQHGTLVLTNSGATLGVPKILSIEAGANDGIAAFLDLKGLEKTFLFYALEQRTDFMRNHLAPGNGQPNLNTDIIASIHVPVPPLPEQRKIAAILSTWDRAIELTEKLLAAKQKRKQALMQQLLTGKLQVGNVDANWKEMSLGKLAEFINGRAFKPAEWTDSGLPIIRIQNLNGSTVFNHFRGYIDDRHRVFPGELLFSWSGSRGTSFGPCFWHGSEGALNQHIFRVIPKDGINQRFLGHALEYVTVLIERTAHGSAGLVHVTKNELERYTFKVPTLSVQVMIAAVLDCAEYETSLLSQRHTIMKQQKKSVDATAAHWQSTSR